MKKENDEVKIFKDEEKILLDHDYDGIRELDNPLPRWWVITFYLTIIFSIPYYLAYTFFDAKSIDESFSEEVAAVKELQDAAELKKGKFSMDEYKVIVADASIMKGAAKVYKRKCKACHGPDGGGGVGPNLADHFWIHGNGSLESKYDVLNRGVVAKGMPAWGITLGKDKVYAVLKYIDDFKGTSPGNPKEAQGEEYK